MRERRINTRSKEKGTSQSLAMQLLELQVTLWQ